MCKICTLVTQDLDQHIGTQDLRPPPSTEMEDLSSSFKANIVSIPCLPFGLSTLRELAYARRRVGKDSLQCFHLYYFLFYYCHLAHKNHLYVNQVNILDHSSETEMLMHS